MEQPRDYVIASNRAGYYVDKLGNKIEQKHPPGFFKKLLVSLLLGMTWVEY